MKGAVIAARACDPKQRNQCVIDDLMDTINDVIERLDNIVRLKKKKRQMLKDIRRGDKGRLDDKLSSSNVSDMLDMPRIYKALIYIRLNVKRLINM